MKNIIPKELLKTLSPLEKDILNCFKDRKELRTKDAYELIRKKKKIAETSIAVILDRLYKKGLVRRTPETCRGGTRFVYGLNGKADDYEQHLIEKSVNTLIQRFGDRALSYFNERFAKK